MADRKNTHGVGSWTTTPALLDGIALDGQTVRVIARVSLGGGTVRVRLSNAYGSRPLTIGAAHIALQGDGANIVADSDRALTFNGDTTIDIAAGALAASIPI